MDLSRGFHFECQYHLKRLKQKQSKTLNQFRLSEPGSILITKDVFNSCCLLAYSSSFSLAIFADSFELSLSRSCETFINVWNFGPLSGSPTWPSTVVSSISDSSDELELSGSVWSMARRSEGDETCADFDLLSRIKTLILSFLKRGRTLKKFLLTWSCFFIWQKTCIISL